MLIVWHLVPFLVQQAPLRTAAVPDAETPGRRRGHGHKESDSNAAMEHMAYTNRLPQDDVS